MSLESLRCVLWSITNLARSWAWACEIWPCKQWLPECFFVTESQERVVHERVLFPTHSGLRINLLWVKKTLCASMATSGGKFRNFQHNLISSTCFCARGRRSSRYRISAILASSESLCYLFSKGTGLAQRWTWVRKIRSCEQRPLECSLCQGVIFLLRFYLDWRSSWQSGNCAL